VRPGVQTGCCDTQAGDAPVPPVCAPPLAAASCTPPSLSARLPSPLASLLAGACAACVDAYVRLHVYVCGPCCAAALTSEPTIFNKRCPPGRHCSRGNSGLPNRCQTSKHAYTYALLIHPPSAGAHTRGMWRYGLSLPACLGQPFLPPQAAFCPPFIWRPSWLPRHCRWQEAAGECNSPAAPGTAEC
jgi:hypothetical protein